MGITSVRSRRTGQWLLWIALGVHAPIAVAAVFHSRLPVADFDNYYEIGTRPGRPYVDFPVEFPVASTETFRTLAPLAGTRARFGVTLVALNVIADLAIVAALWWGWNAEAAACYALVVAPLLDLYLLRLDLWSTALATFAAAAWRRDRAVFTAIGVSAGAAFKLWPIAFVPLVFVPSRGRVRLAPIATALAAGLVVCGAWLWVAGPAGVYQVLTFRGSRGWEVESTVGGIWMLVDRSSVRLEHGAWRIGTMVGPTSIVLFVLGGAPCLWMIWRGARAQHLGAGWAGGLSALLACSAVLSPQYSAWFAPASGVAWVEGDTRIAALTAAVVFLTNLEYKSFVPLLRGETAAITLVLVRNVALVALAVLAGRLVATSRAPQPGASSAGGGQIGP